jgi:hypothetical protein
MEKDKYKRYNIHSQFKGFFTKRCNHSSILYISERSRLSIDDFNSKNYYIYVFGGHCGDIYFNVFLKFKKKDIFSFDIRMSQWKKIETKKEEFDTIKPKGRQGN